MTAIQIPVGVTPTTITAVMPWNDSAIQIPVGVNPTTVTAVTIGNAVIEEASCELLPVISKLMLL
jgi:hypothetical protein